MGVSTLFYHLRYGSFANVAGIINHINSFWPTGYGQGGNSLLQHCFTCEVVDTNNSFLAGFDKGQFGLTVLYGIAYNVQWRIAANFAKTYIF